MKKIIGLIFAILFCINLSANANNIEVQPTMLTRTNAQDRVWVGSFQLVWNDFMNRVVHNPIRFREGTPVSAVELNLQTFTEDDISEDSYYKMAGKVTKKVKKQIAKAIRKKFKESSDLLDKIALSPRNDKYIIYAMLKKEFEFVHEFDKLGESSFGEDQVAEYFGIGANSNNLLGNGVRVLFYNSPDDFAIKLLTKDNEEVVIYKNSSNKSFASLYYDMMKKQAAYTGDRQFQDSDELSVPKVKLFEEKYYEEFSKRRVMGTNIIIEEALQTVKFSMNNKGVVLKSEAELGFVTTSLRPENPPRFFNVNDTFVIFLQEKGKEKPYFALRVNDISKFQK